MLSNFRFKCVNHNFCISIRCHNLTIIFVSQYVVIIYPFKWSNYVINFLHLNVLTIIYLFEWLNYVVNFLHPNL
ncbi:putative membrane protein [Acanthamoeba castellanii mamavirus]|nr:putative membrane protein [Acanthamoeba castellanii mamavirus]